MYLLCMSLVIIHTEELSINSTNNLTEYEVKKRVMRLYLGGSTQSLNAILCGEISLVRE